MNDRERLIELLEAKYDHYCDQCGVNKQTDYIENLADYLISHGVTVQKHGRWIMRGGYRYCSACERRACVTRDREDFWYTVGTNFCPNCGAIMDGEADEH